MSSISERVQLVRELHTEERGHCAECSWPWPCETRRLLDPKNADASELTGFIGRAKKAEAAVVQVEALVTALRARGEDEADALADAIAGALAEPDPVARATCISTLELSLALLRGDE